MNDASSLFCVRFRRPDGQTFWLGEAGAGKAATADDAWRGSEYVARSLADERNFTFGPSGYEYWIEPATKGD